MHYSVVRPDGIITTTVRSPVICDLLPTGRVKSGLCSHLVKWSPCRRKCGLSGKICSVYRPWIRNSCVDDTELSVDLQSFVTYAFAGMLSLLSFIGLAGITTCRLPLRTTTTINCYAACPWATGTISTPLIWSRIEEPSKGVHPFSITLGTSKFEVILYRRYKPWPPHYFISVLEN